MIVCVGLIVTGVLDAKTAFAGFIDSNVILFVAMFIVGGAFFETGMANKIGGIVTKFAKSESCLLYTSVQKERTVRCMCLSSPYIRMIWEAAVTILLQ